MATVINVYGTARSGSTMLDLMLGNALDAFSCGEVSAWFRPYRRHHFTIDCSCGRHPCSVWAKIGYVKESQFYAAVIQELGTSFVIDSSKDLCWIMDGQKWTAASNFQTHNLVIWKDPVDLAYSHWKRDHGLTDWRTDFIRTYSRFFETGLPFLAVNYSALAENPRHHLMAICDAVGMGYSEGRERFRDKEHHYLFGSAEVRRHAEDSVVAITARLPFPPVFEATRPFLEDHIASDAALQNVLAALKAADVASIKGSRPTWPSTLSPLWYYGKRVTRFLRRYVPEHYDPMAP